MKENQNPQGSPAPKPVLATETAAQSPAPEKQSPQPNLSVNPIYSDLICRLCQIRVDYELMATQFEEETANPHNCERDEFYNSIQACVVGVGMFLAEDVQYQAAHFYENGKEASCTQQ